MGMFDYVNFECKCPGCGAIITGFQSKSGICILDTVEPWTVNNFYTSCANCDGWIDYKRVDYLEGPDKMFENSIKADKLLRKIKKDHEEFNELGIDTLEELYAYIETTPIPENTEWLDLYEVKFQTQADRQAEWDKFNKEYEESRIRENARAKEDQTEE